MWYVAIAARAMRFTLDSIAQQNLQDNEHRWLSEREVSGDLFAIDEDFCSEFPKNEQLPQCFWAKFVSSEEDGLPKIEVFIYIEGCSEPFPFGNRVDDNANSADGYRFHDIFHFGYCAYLDWSPVVRHLLRRKRKSDANVDRIQDGARARDREEATTNFIYEYVVRHNFLKNAESVDTSLLDLIQSMTSDLEVAARRKHRWQELIINCARIQTKLMENNGGWVNVDRHQRTINYSKSGPK